MESKNRIKDILYLVVIAAIAFLVFSCSSTKKLKQKEETKNEIKKESDSTGTTAAKVEEKKTEETTKKSSEEKKSYDVKVVDGKEVSIKEYDENGKLTGKTVIKGDGEVTTSSEKNESSETIKTDQSKKSHTNASTAVKKKGNETTEGKKLNLDLEKKGFSFGDYIFWFILIIAIIILIYLNNRFKWIPIFKKTDSNE